MKILDNLILMGVISKLINFNMPQLVPVSLDTKQRLNQKNLIFFVSVLSVVEARIFVSNK